MENSSSVLPSLQRVPVGLALVGLLLIGGEARASTIVALDERALTRRADLVGFGSIISTRTVTRPGSQAVVTIAEAQLYRTVRGAASGDVITLQVMGGRLDNGLVARTVGAPVLEAGQMFVGFLEQRGGVYRPLGLSYGYLKVHRDSSGIFRVSRDVQGLGLLAPGGGSVAPEVWRLRDVPLEQLLDRLSGHLKNPDEAISDEELLQGGGWHGTVKP